MDGRKKIISVAVLLSGRWLGLLEMTVVYLAIKVCC